MAPPVAPAMDRPVPPDSHPPATVTAATLRRNRSIRRAILTSFLSKGGTALLQLVSLPIAIRVLGREEFGLYGSVNLVLATVLLFQIGIGPALAHGLAKAEDQPETRRRLASTAWALSAGLALAAAGLFALVLAFVPLPVLYGEGFAGKEAALRPALWLGLALFGLLLLLNLTDRLREGCLEAHANNLWGAGGNLFAAAAVGLGIWIFPEVWFLVLAVHGSQILAKLGNLFALWKKHPDLRPSRRACHLPTARHLFSDGLAFATYSMITGLIEFNLAGWIAGRIGGPSQVALFTVFISLTVLQLGFVMMVSTPTWPAIAEAMARGDLPWARRAARHLALYATAVAVASAAGLLLLGPWFFPRWLGPDFADVGRLTFACYALYFFAHTWRHAGHMLMIGTGQVKPLAAIQIKESLAVAVLAPIAMSLGGVPAMLATMGITILAITGWILPGRVRTALRDGH